MALNLSNQLFGTSIFEPTREDGDIDRWEGSRYFPSADAINTAPITMFWACSGINFVPINPDIDDVAYNGAIGDITTTGAAIQLVANVNLPRGCKIINAIVLGNTSTESFGILEVNLDGTIGTALAGTTINSTATVAGGGHIADTENKAYIIYTNELDAGERYMELK